ncbi:MAG: polyprenyl diphosphate synthase [archaeon YNP-WB-040]|jgi:tritrans,polycis-undecaprenyl-diphosphate synthase [geranylgeranyl-diphosphate specific]|nr:polyprenyl diphosphate synthase [Candidatus Culexarchaeum yellowstonense]
MLRRLLEIIGIYKLYEKWLWRQIKDKEKPTHVGIILDGNRRWARERKLPPWMGHEKGAEKVKDVIKWCYEAGIKILTLYVFSTENFNRSREEVEAIMNLAKRYVQEYMNDKNIHEKKVKVKLLGKRELLDEDLRRKIEELEKVTENYNERYLNIALAYGGRVEIVDAVKEICRKIMNGEIKVDEINEEIIEKHLYTSHLPQPSPDLIIRTSGEERLSGFLLWQSAYSELVFLDVYWPDFRKIDFWRAIRTYQRRNRRFGR